MDGRHEPIASERKPSPHPVWLVALYSWNSKDASFPHDSLVLLLLTRLLVDLSVRPLGKRCEDVGLPTDLLFCA